MKIALAQLNYHVGNFAYNEQKIIKHIHKAKSRGADLVVFSEMAICGYPPLDLLEREDFVKRVQLSLEKIRLASDGIGVIVGAPSKNEAVCGKKLYNSAYFFYDKSLLKVQHKTLLPNYDVFDECRYFEPNTTFEIVEYKGKRIALTICEDLWEEQPESNNFTKRKLHTQSPMEQLSALSPDVVINIASSLFSTEKEAVRSSILTQMCQKYHLPLVYVNQVGANTELIFDGGSKVLSKKGKLKLQMRTFFEDFKIIAVDEIGDMKTLKEKKNKKTVKFIHEALLLGVRDYFKKTGFTKALVGLSGGLDSAVTLVLAQRALGSENVHAILMPSQFSSVHSVDDAVALAENIGVSYDIIPIESSYNEVVHTMQSIFKDLPFDVTEENIQARLRGLLLMAYSNKFGNLLLNTSNKSEMAVGYGTLYGDMNGSISVLGDVYKTEVFELARYMNKDEEIIPEHTILKPPSAELRPDQKDSDSLPDYAVLDAILQLYIEENLSAEAIVSRGFDEQVVSRVVTLTNRNEYKRFQSAPVLRVSTKAFGFGRRIPLVCNF